MEYHIVGDENVTFKSVRAENKKDAIATALSQLPDVGPDWQEASIIHNEDDVYVVRATAPKTAV